MTVKELNQDQLETLKFNYFYGEDDDEGHTDEYDTFYDVPDEVIFKHYADIDFVPDDFGCSQGEDDGEED